ncbi:MAG: glycerate kinase [Selenomonadaceae bacterium]|nr:glycerate kinase [Selenomonadaceae bacterium]
MKAVIAIDSFKGSLSSAEAGEAASRAIRYVFPEADIVQFPLADGGEGTVDALTEGLAGRIITTEVTGPLGKREASRYGIISDGRIAVIEMADAAGLTMVPMALRNPLNTTTYGLGELIVQAMDNGCREFIIGIGGSATNDAGLGMLSALGAGFFQADGQRAGITGGSVKDVVRIDLTELDSRIRECTFHIACDVNNPLCGDSGCSAVYGPQKGATPDIVREMDEAIAKFAGLARRQYGITGAELPGAGAAGGLGYAFHGFLGGSLEPGAKLVLNVLGIEDELKNADILITGEGRMDSQTAMGKAPAEVAQLAKTVNPSIKTIAVCGCAAPDADVVNKAGIDAYFPILHQVMSLDEAMDKAVADRNLYQTLVQVMRLAVFK